MEIVGLISLRRGTKFLSIALGKCVLESSALLLAQIILFFGEICEGCARVFLPPAHSLQLSFDGLAASAYGRIKGGLSTSNIVTELFSSFTAS